jgi:hypothetical protein
VCAGVHPYHQGMTTESPHPRVAAARPPLRLPRRWPFGQDATGVMAALAVVVALIYGLALVDRHAEIYREAGAAAFEAASGALVAQVLVLLALLAAGVAYRRGYPMRWVHLAAGVAAVFAVAFALLPHLAAGHDWLTTLLGFLVAIVFGLVLAVEVLLAAVYAPLWWERQR